MSIPLMKKVISLGQLLLETGNSEDISRDSSSNSGFSFAFKRFGLDVNLTATQPWAWIAIVVVTLWWGAGGNMIIYVAALNAVPKEQMEAAQLDGAGNVARFFKIILPNIRSQILFTTVMTTISQFNIYGQPLMLTGGGPNNSTKVLMMYIQQNAFGTGISTAGMSAAMAVLLGLIIMVFSGIQFVMNRRSNA
ncbi:hypothetical protein C823_006463 [Eubacterium plexicaudatum ASF492]|uniref:ABC transmembrane type-1 domain-containing protein n=1 Tax=Eubacterium plexicaudatum ASF492 TaxID=1235802 RepID=N2ACV0_9FIRM|nr:hypothetical protein C823_006463 [Eubacterium plexicaudatum ASF492]